MITSKLLVGLTGGIASGKSTAVKTFEAHGIPNVDADIVAREIVEVGKPGWQCIRDVFGLSFLLEDKSINRSKLGKFVFHNAKAMNKLNIIMAPLIIEESRKQILELQTHNSIVIYNAALICEMGNANNYKPLIVVSCPEHIQLERLMKRNKLTEEEAMSRIASQMPVAAKIKLADYVIDTSKTIEHSVLQTEAILKILKSV